MKHDSNERTPAVDDRLIMLGSIMNYRSRNTLAVAATTAQCLSYADGPRKVELDALERVQ